MIAVRTARESDASGICDLFKAAYGEDYCYPQFFDPSRMRKAILADDTVVVVAEDQETGDILGTASVLEEKGAYTDLTGEFGRLVVHPQARKRGVGHLLMEGRLDRVQERLHVGIVESRVVHPFSSRIAASHGFSVVGYLPARLEISFRENLCLMVRHFGHALDLRRNNPRIVPEAYPIAHLAMENCSLRFDAIVDEDSHPYPHNDGFEIETLTTDGYAALLRIERGRLRKREVFGPLRLQYGFFKLRAANSYYLIAKDEGHLVGAVGFTADRSEKGATIFELISIQDDAIRFLLERLIEVCRADHGAVGIHIDVSAYAPSMQRTLLELGFLPVGYVPAQVFHRTERLDVIKMSRIFVPIDSSRDQLIPEAKAMAEKVISSFVRRDVEPRILEAAGKVALFEGLSEEQKKRAIRCCRRQVFAQGEVIFEQASESDRLYLIIAGEVDIHLQGRSSPVGQVAAGECLGEMSALSGIPHTATARTRSDVEAAVLLKDEFQRLIRLRPDIGVVLYRNLAIGLAGKLHRSDLAFPQV